MGSRDQSVDQSDVVTSRSYTYMSEESDTDSEEEGTYVYTHAGMYVYTCRYVRIHPNAKIHIMYMWLPLSSHMHLVKSGTK